MTKYITFHYYLDFNRKLASRQHPVRAPLVIISKPLGLLRILFELSFGSDYTENEPCQQEVHEILLNYRQMQVLRVQKSKTVRLFKWLDTKSSRKILFFLGLHLLFFPPFFRLAVLRNVNTVGQIKQRYDLSY